MRYRRSVLAPVAVLATAVITGGWFLQQGVDQEQNVYFQARLFQEVVDRIASDYVERVPKDSLYRSAIDGLITSLGDPNSSFLEAKDYEDLRIRTQGDYGGVGLEITERDGYVTVVSPIPGTPGQRAGIRAGDQFVEIEGRDAAGWKSDQAVEVLRGAPGSEVHVKVRRLGVDQPIPFTLKRERIHLNSVPFSVALPGGIAYVPMKVVRETSSAELRTSLDSLKGVGGLRGIVLDLRDNPGGLLEQGIAVSDQFVPRGASIVETRGRAARQSETFKAPRGDRYENIPVVVLVNEYSASASEIISGALQDHDRAVVVGMPSYGKGSVQTLFRVSGGNVLRLTTARWYTPLGRSIDKPHDEQLAARSRETGTLTIEGAPTRPAVLEGRPTITSPSGRTLYGGGGITPDVIVLEDTLTIEEQTGARVLFRQAGAVETALFNLAVRLIQERPNIQPDFTIGDAEIERVYESLSDSVRAEIPEEDWNRASRFLRHNLERKIALQKWGEVGEFRRTMIYDPQLKAALDLLSRADSPAALFRAADEARARASMPARGAAGPARARAGAG
jgi:carboxyl-terminal processing protease